MTELERVKTENAELKRQLEERRLTKRTFLLSLGLVCSTWSTLWLWRLTGDNVAGFSFCIGIALYLWETWNS